MPRSDAETRFEILQYLDACGRSPDEYDVDALMADIVRWFGPVELDDIDPLVFNALLLRHERGGWVAWLATMGDQERLDLLIMLCATFPQVVSVVTKMMEEGPREGR